MRSRNHAELTLDKRDVLERNAKVDRTVVASYKRLERDLRRLGIEVRPRYTLEPPLGSGRPRDHGLTAWQPGDARSRNAAQQR